MCIRDSDGVWFYSKNNSTNKEELVITYTDPASTPTPTATPTTGPTATPTPTSTASSSATFTYDANGNMTADGTKCYHYNEANQLDKVTKCSGGQTIAEYVYDYTGLRMVKKNFTNGTLANTVTSWSDSYETKVIEGGATENTAYYFANGQLIGKKDKDGVRTYVHADHLGSTRLITNSSGSTVETTAYDPWGKVKNGGTKSKFLYTGQEKDDETGLHYYNARYYDSEIRRFIQPDDLVQNAFDPQSLNRYSYVQNNPLRYVDPTGHVVTCSASGCYSSFTVLNSQPKKPAAPVSSYKPVNQVLGIKSPIQVQTNTNKGGGGGGGGSTGGGNTGGTQNGNVSAPEVVKTVYSKVALPTYNFFIGDDLNTVMNPHASPMQRGISAAFLAANVVPASKVAKLGKVAEGIIDTTKMFNPNQAALVDLAKDAKKMGISNEDADALLKWGDEYKMIPTLDHRGTTHWVGGDHIRIGPVNHIPVK